MSDAASPHTPYATHIPRKLPPSGWYTDPDCGNGRFWDGQRWTSEFWSAGPLPAIGWYRPITPGAGPRWWAGTGRALVAPHNAWRPLVKRLRTVREIFELPEYQEALTGVGEYIADSTSSPWLDGDALAKELYAEMMRFVRMLSTAAVPPRFVNDAHFRHDLAENTRRSLAMIAGRRYLLRQERLRSHDPERREEGSSFHPGGPAPEPVRFGVSHEGAERLVAEWMIHYGEVDASVTRFTGDGGIDVESAHYVAQVKNFGKSQSVPSSDVRELQGVAAISGRKALFFTSGLYTKGSVDFADAVGMALFRYDAEAGSLRGQNERAVRLLQTGF